MIKGVIFDVDGVLLDSMPVWEHLGERYLERLGIRPEEGLAQAIGTMSMEEAADYLIRRYRLSMKPDEVVREVVLLIREAYQEQIPPKPGVDRLLKEFSSRKIPMVIATSGDRENASLALERLGFLSFFQEIFTCTEIGKSKRWPDIYLAASRHLKMPPEEILVFEDSLGGLQTAKKAGFHTAAVYDAAAEGQQARLREEADIYLKDFQDHEKIFVTVNPEG